MRKLGSWIMKDDRRFLAAVSIGAALVLSLTWLCFTRFVPILEAAAYERPALVSDVTIDVPERAAQVLGDDSEVRFVVDLRCGEVDALGCAQSSRPGVIYLDAEYAEEAIWNEARSVVIHESAHAAEQLHGLDVIEFGAIDSGVELDEAFADCVAAALEGAETNYVRCPVEWQERALNALGIDRLARVWLDGESEQTLALWR